MDNGERFVETLNERFQAVAIRVATRQLHNPQDAEDAVQDALIAAWQSRASYDPDLGSLKSCFLKIVDDCCKEQVRSRNGLRPRRTRDKPQILALEDLDDESAADEWDDERIALGQMVSRLSERQRQVVALYYQGYTLAETAAKLRLRIPTVQDYLNCAIVNLRKQARRDGLPGDTSP